MAARTDLHQLTATELAALVRERKVSPVEIVQALLARAEAVDSRVQAWERLDTDRALAAARVAEQQVAEGKPLGPLHGVPFAAKDIFDTAGLRTAASFAPFDQRVPTEDAEVIARLKAAGAILLGKTVTTQFAYSDPSRTRNPWSDKHTPGGSSSGSGAGVAARLVPFALGTQTAGSVLRPAAYNGAVGFKPTYGRVSTRGVLPLSVSLDTVGVIARCVADCELFLQAGSSEPFTPQPTFTPRIGLYEPGLNRSAPALRQHLQTAAERLRAAGAVVTTLGDDAVYDEGLTAHLAIMQTEAADVHAERLATHPDAYGPLLAAYVREGQSRPPSTHADGARLRERVRESIEGLFAEVDVLLLPTAGDVAPTPETTGDKTLQAVVTLLGLPSISLPSGLSAEGLPLAIQLVGARGEDGALLAAARWVESQLGPMPAPPL